MKRLMTITLLTMTMSAGAAQDSSHRFIQTGASCLQTLNSTYVENGAPFDVADKGELQEYFLDQNDTSLSEEELMLVKGLLLQSNTEVYIPYDSADAGLYLHIVEKETCGMLWTGFVFNN